jgi:hypothetical protein
MWIAAGLALSVVTKPAPRRPALGSVALAAAATDAGTVAVEMTDAGRIIRPTPPAERTVDGGTLITPTPPSADTVELLRLRGEVELLKQRTAALEQQLELQRQQEAQTQAIVHQLEGLRAEVESGNAAQAERERAAAAQVAKGQGAVNALMGAVTQLQVGDSNIEGALHAAEAAGLTPVAQQDLYMARQSLANGDLRIATNYILQAIDDSQYAR